MNATELTRQPAGQSLKSELARYCLPQSKRDPDRRLAWVNSLCFLFLVIGIAGGKPASMFIKRPPPIEQVASVIVEPLPPPPVRVEPLQNPEPKEDKPDTTPVVVATPETPAINFS